MKGNSFSYYYYKSYNELLMDMANIKEIKKIMRARILLDREQFEDLIVKFNIVFQLTDAELRQVSIKAFGKIKKAYIWKSGISTTKKYNFQFTIWVK